MHIKMLDKLIADEGHERPCLNNDRLRACVSDLGHDVLLAGI
jgi:hypothetical protein